MSKFSKIESILLSILFFIIILFIMFIILVFIFGNNLYNTGRLAGLIVLFICGFLTKLFYDKTRIK